MITAHVMITAQVKGLYTVEMNRLEDHPPADLEAFCIVVRAMVGPRGSPGEESFDIKVATPKWIEQRLEKEGFLFGRHYLFVRGFEIPQIDRLITRFVERCTGETWDEVATKVGRIGLWEFEDYPA